jgi:hemerythrin superfamily protein
MMPNAITMLKSDHAKVKRLLRELNDTTAPKRRESLVADIERELKTHAQIEEEVFYPAFKAAAGKTDAVDMFYEAAEEHHLLDMELPTLKTANSKSPEFAAKAKVLMELVEHHVKDEENEMFPKMRQLCSEEQLREIGDLMQARKESIEAMWDHPILRQVKKVQSAAHKMMPTKVKTAKAAVISKVMSAREEAR